MDSDAGAAAASPAARRRKKQKSTIPILLFSTDSEGGKEGNLPAPTAQPDKLAGPRLGRCWAMSAALGPRPRATGQARSPGFARKLQGVGVLVVVVSSGRLQTKDREIGLLESFRLDPQSTLSFMAPARARPQTGGRTRRALPRFLSAATQRPPPRPVGYPGHVKGLQASGFPADAAWGAQSLSSFARSATRTRTARDKRQCLHRESQTPWTIHILRG